VKFTYLSGCENPLHPGILEAAAGEPENKMIH